MTEPDARLAALDKIDLDQFEDYESADLEDDLAGSVAEADARGRNSYIGELWSRYGYEDSAQGKTRGRHDRTHALITAHKMVQAFINTFATGDVRYRVTFDPSVSTAGTDLIGKAIAISPAPVYDDTLSAQEAGVILTAMAVHEASHVRYGRSTAAAIRRVFGNKRAPNTLCNILEDVRIEARFAEDYPGYADIFAAMTDYVGKQRQGKIVPRMTDLVNLAGVALRYPQFVDWSDPQVAAERDWWQAWGKRWSKEDAPRRHVEAIREGLKRIVYVQAKLAAQNEILLDAMKSKKELPPDLERVGESLRGLTPIARKAMRLTAEGKTGSEIAATLGLSLVDTKILIRSTRRQMAEKATGGRSNRSSVTVTLNGNSADLIKRLTEGLAR